MFGRQCTTSEGIRVISEPPGTFRKISLEITQRRDEAEATRGTVICYSSVHPCTIHLLTIYRPIHHLTAQPSIHLPAYPSIICLPPTDIR